MSEERKHSILAPSSKEWVHCGFSAKFLANKEEETNDASEFGTECHALAEAYIKQSLKIEDFDEKPVSIDELKSTFKHYDDEMETLATGYANFVIGQADYEEKRTGKKPLVFVEQLLEMDYAPDTHGTADAIIIAGDTLTIIDNKTGFIPVKIFEGNELNSQLGIYGLYAYKLFADIYPIKKIRLVIYQERIHNIDASEEMIRARRLCQLANETPIDNPEYVKYLEELFNRKLDGIRILTPFICDFGNRVTFGKNVFINHSAILSASGGIEFEDGVSVAPGVRIATINHDFNNRHTIYTLLMCDKEVIEV